MSQQEPQFFGLHFWVADMPKTIAFYRAIGLVIPENAERQSFVDLKLPNGITLAFATDDITHRYDPAFARGEGRAPNALQFYLSSRAAVDDLYAALVGAGYPSNLAPIDAFWGNRYAEVIDPDGNVVGFHSRPERL
jgi:catechol 2,3-dioxygenase-like lactoylglutathione lyase family enzyme